MEQNKSLRLEARLLDSKVHILVDKMIDEEMKELRDQMAKKQYLAPVNIRPERM